MPTAFSRTKEEAQGGQNFVYRSFSIHLDTVTAATIVASLPCDFAGKVIALRIHPSSPTTTASDAATFAVHLQKGGAAQAAVTSCSIATTSANTDAFGEAPLSATAADDASRDFAAGDFIDIVASSVTDYAEGVMNFELVLQPEA